MESNSYWKSTSEPGLHNTSHTLETPEPKNRLVLNSAGPTTYISNIYNLLDSQ